MKSSEDSPITEVFITHIKPGKYEEYRDWALKIHQIEKTFPGYLGVDIKAPSVHERNSWITILHFDSKKNLNHWLSSQQRKEILKESESFVDHYESHQLNNPFLGWFEKPSKASKKSLSTIKETMLVLLVLFPIVMLEMKFLSPFTKELNVSVATFIGNAISVSLISWPMMPICLYFLHSWLSIEDVSKERLKNICGFLLVFVLYLIEILIFAKF